MKTSNLKDMTNGWFVGNFDPSLIKTNEVEVAVKYYNAGQSESRHFHKVATELTVIVSGEVRMNNLVYKQGDIVIINPGDVTDFYSITDSITTVVKYPGAKNDKYEA